MPEPFDWRAYLPQLNGYPLLPCGAGAEGKAPLDPATGGPAQHWQHAAYTPDQIAQLNGSVLCVGTRTGPDAGGLLVFDLDGQSAIDYCIARGCDPFATTTWHIVRDTDTTRLKLAFKLPPDLWPHLGQIKRKHTTLPATDAAKAEQVELFFGRGQIIVLGSHITSGGHYYWPEGHTPAELSEPPPAWWALALQLAAGGRQEAPGQGRIILGEPPAAHPVHRPVDDLTRAADAIRALDPAMGHDDWLTVGMALHAIDPVAGEAVWDSWSRGCPQKYDARVIAQKWRSFKPGGGITPNTLFGLAINAGWRDPFVSSHRAAPSSASGFQAPPGGPSGTAAGSDDRLPRSALLSAALDAAQAADDDTYAELMAELMTRFRIGPGAIQAALFRLLTARRAGGPTPAPGVVNIEHADHLEHLLPGFIPAREQSLLFAPRGAGKTIAALAIARAIVTGAPLLDQGDGTTPGRVLYLATDSGCASMRTQMQELGLLDSQLFQHGHPDQRFFLRGYDATQGISAWEANIPEVLWLIRFVQDHAIDLVIIDSAKACLALTETDYADNRAVGALLTLFQRVVCPHASILWLNHDGRENGHNAGAKAWAEIPVMVHRIERVEEQRKGPPSSGEDDRGRVPPNARRWHCVKSRIRNDERSFLYQLDSEGDLIVSDEVEIAASCRDAVIQVFRDARSEGKDQLHRTELFARVMRDHGRSSKSVENTLAAMTRGLKRDLVRPRRGFYSIAPALLEELVSIRGWGTDGGGNRKIPSSAMDLPSPHTSPDGGNFPPDVPPDGGNRGEPKPIAAQSKSLKHPPARTPTPKEAAGADAPGPSQTHDGETPPQLVRLGVPVDSKAPPNAPPWFGRLVQLRRERPNTAPATLALVIDEQATGTPTGAQVKAWLAHADRLIADGGADD